MSRAEPAIFTTMVMVCDGDKILVQERRDPSWPGISFPGGHVEPCESFVKCAVREIYEETGLTISNLHLCGMKQFTHRRGDYRYIVFFYKTDCFSGDLTASDEGRVFWIDRSELKNYVLADGFDSMYEIFVRDDVSENYHWFDGKWHVENL